MSRLCYIAMLFTAAICFIAEPALAHPKLTAAIPAADTQARSPQEIRLSFSEALVPTFSGLDLKDQDGKPVETGPAASDPKDRKQLIVAIKAALSPGRYTVEWHAVSEDTHRVKGSYSLEVKVRVSPTFVPSRRSSPCLKRTGWCFSQRQRRPSRASRCAPIARRPRDCGRTFHQGSAYTPLRRFVSCFQTKRSAHDARQKTLVQLVADAVDDGVEFLGELRVLGDTAWECQGRGGGTPYEVFFKATGVALNV